MSKTKQFGICAICGEPVAMNELTPDGLCPDCEGARLDADFDDITGNSKTITAAKHNNANADVLNQMFAYFI